jgi:hypothetical protein
METKSYKNRSSLQGVTVTGTGNLEAHPSEANTYAWFALRHGRMYIYGGRTQHGLNYRFLNPYGYAAVSHRVLELLRKATGKSYSAGDLVFNNSAITVVKSSKKNNSAADEQKVINACWKFEQDVADSFGSAGLVFSLNAQGVDRSQQYCQRTYDSLQTAFDASVGADNSFSISKGRSKSVLKKALATLKRLKAKSIKRENA